jgi:hypothetical protein
VLRIDGGGAGNRKDDGGGDDSAFHDPSSVGIESDGLRMSADQRQIKLSFGQDDEPRHNERENAAASSEDAALR